MTKILKKLFKEPWFSWMWFGMFGRSWKGVGVDNADGTLNKPLFTKWVMQAAKAGSNFVRMMMFWAESILDILSTPFGWEDGKKKYRLLNPDGTLNKNPKYFPKLQQACDKINEKIGLFVIGFLDRCGVKDRGERQKYNPWTNNIEGFDGWWDTKTFFRIKTGPNKGKKLYAKDVVLLLVDEVCKTLGERNWLPEIGNELELKDVEIQKAIIAHLRKKKMKYFFRKYRIIKNGFVHDSPAWIKKISGWHWWQKTKAWFLDPILIEVWHWFQLWDKLDKMAKENRHIIITPWTWFSIDGIGRVVISAKDLIKKFSVILPQKGKGKWNAWMNRRPFFEIMRTPQNPDHWEVLNKLCIEYTGEPLLNFIKYKDLSFEDIEREYQEAIKLKEDPVTETEEETEVKVPKPTPKKEKNKMKNHFDFKGYLCTIKEKFFTPMFILSMGLAGLIGVLVRRPLFVFILTGAALAGYIVKLIVDATKK